MNLATFYFLKDASDDSQNATLFFDSVYLIRTSEAQSQSPSSDFPTLCTWIWRKCIPGKSTPITMLVEEKKRHFFRWL